MVALDGGRERKELHVLFWIILWRWVSPSRALYTVLSIDVAHTKGWILKKNWLEIVFVQTWNHNMHLMWPHVEMFGCRDFRALVGFATKQGGEVRYWMDI